MIINLSDYFEYDDSYSWTLSDSRYEEIKEIVVSTFEKYNVNCVPVSGFELATKMGVTVIPYSARSPEKREILIKKSKDGFCFQKQDESWYIFYNDDCDYGRINNTILHEIGHIVLDHSEDSNLAEYEVKFFAKYALVPPVLVLKLDLKSPEEIEKVFEVSNQAAYYAWDYYQKWLGRNKDYTSYEVRMLKLFDKYLVGGGVT